MSDMDMELGLGSFEFDFDSIEIPPGLYAAEVSSVIFRGKQPKSNDPSATTTGIQLNFKLDTEDSYNGQFVGKYVWLCNNDDRPGPIGLRTFAAFVEAVTGEKPTGQLALSAYEPQKKTNKKGADEIHLTSFEGLRCAVQLDTEVDKNDATITRTVVKSFMSESKLAESSAGQESFGEF